MAQPRKTSAFQQLMSVHWIMASCYLLLFTTGPFMARLSREVLIRNSLYDFHKSIGALTMGILTWRIALLLRVWWRKYTRRKPTLTREWIQKVALHTSLYVFMLVIPITGFFFSNSYKSNNLHFFWIVTLPDLFPQNDSLVDLGRSLHFWLAYTFLAFIILHAIEQWKVIRANWRRFLNRIRTQFTATSK